MGTPIDARHIADANGDFAPQTQDAWFIEIADLDDDGAELIRLSCMSSQLPTENNEIVVVPMGNSEAKYAGKGHFEDIPLTVRDFVDRKVRDALLAWRRQVWNPEDGSISLPSVYKRNVDLIIQSQDGSIIRTATIKGAWPSSMNPGTLDHGSSEPVLIEMTLTYDWAKWDL
jgi:hypothetical protein